MADQELRIPPTQAGIDRMCLLWGKAAYANIETELLLLKERKAHQEQVELLMKQIAPVVPPAEPADEIEPTPIKATRAKGG